MDKSFEKLGTEGELRDRTEGGNGCALGMRGTKARLNAD